MKRIRDRKPITIDIDHMRMLHEEANEQLELMRVSLQAADHATGNTKDSLDDIVENHWQAYMDVMHMICIHDEAMNSVIKKYGMNQHETCNEDTERQHGSSRSLLLFLLLALIQRHRRFSHIFALRGTPMGDYLKESMVMEREHTAELIAMIQNMV